MRTPAAPFAGSVAQYRGGRWVLVDIYRREDGRTLPVLIQPTPAVSTATYDTATYDTATYGA